MNLRHLLLCILLFAAAMAVDALEAGMGVADITPDVSAFKVSMAGYGARMGRPATGVHDPLHAKVLFLRDGARSMALVACDLRSSTPEFKAQIVQKVSDCGLGQDSVFVAASHTHDGPSMYPEKFWKLQFGAYDPRIVDSMTTAIANAVHDAVRSAAPAQIGFGTGLAAGFTRNRRWEYDLEKRENSGETPVVDPRLSVVRIDGMDKTCRAVVVHFAAHPTLLDSSNMLISAEWPGVLQREIEKEFPGSIALYLNGGEGDQSPSGAVGADDFERMEDYGKRLAALTVPIATAIESKPDMSIGFARGTPDLPGLVFPESARAKFALLETAAREALPRQAELHVFQIGPVILAGLPGEPILEVARSVEARLASDGFEIPLAVGLANDYIGYLVNEKEYAHGGYEVESRSYYGPGLGTFLVEQTAAVAAKLTRP